MNQDSLTPGRLTSRAPVFFWITVGLLALLFVGGIAVALLLALEAKEINRQGGWGWLLVGGIYVAAATVICSACGICAAVSLFRREAYRPLSMAILIISSLVVWAFGPNLIRVVNRLRRQHQELARTDKHSAQPPSGSTPRATIPSTVDKSANAPAVRELKSKLWEAIRTKNADAFVDCYCIEARFNTPEVREANRSQAEISLRSETIDVEIRDIPDPSSTV